MTFSKILLPFAALFSFLFVFCNTIESFQSPPGYDLSQAQKTRMPHSLDEISGIVFLKGKPDDLFAIQDEEGKLFRYTFSTQKHRHSKFSTKGDFEDLTVLQDSVFVILKSDGTLYTFPIAEAENEIAGHVNEYRSVLPQGEYEGLFARNGRLYVLCKDCPGDNEKKNVTVYEVILSVDVKPNVVKPIKINFSKARKEIHAEKQHFHPSCLAFQPVTHQWYIISSVNKIMMVMDTDWNVKEEYLLDPSLFKQPEGITFSSNGDMYISNEAAGGTANVLLFRYKSPVNR